jgi:hypothetical protein
LIDIFQALDLLFTLRPKGQDEAELFLAQTQGAGSQGPEPYDDMPPLESAYRPSQSDSNDNNVDTPPGYLDVIQTASNKVIVTEGWVVERIARNALAPDDNSLRYRDVAGIKNGDGTPIEHTVAAGDFLYIHVNITARGRWGQSQFLKSAVEMPSVHYIPAVGASVGSAGNYYYLLAKVVAVGEALTLEKKLAGANIEHFAELPTLANLGSGASVLNQFNATTGEYEIRTFTAAHPLAVTPLGNVLHFTFTGGANLNWEVYQTTFSYNVDGNLVASRATTPEYTVYVRNGIVMGLMNPDAPGAPPPVVVSSDRNSVPAAPP